MNYIVCARMIDIHTANRSIDYSHKCGLCGARVGMYPSGQAMLKANPTFEVACLKCVEQGNLGTDEDTVFMAAPGAIEEMLKELWEEEWPTWFARNATKN